MKSKIMNMKSIITSKISSANRNNLLLSVVALVEIIAIMIVSTSAWVETISTVEISGTKGSIASSIYTNANFDGTEKEIDLSQYFNESGNVHLSSASSADGENFFFPKIGTNPVTYRKGTINDVNVNYISFSIRVTASRNANEFFFGQIPTIMIGDKDVIDSSVRIAISKSGQEPIIFSKSETSEKAVVAADGAKEDTTVNLFNTYVGAEAEQPIFSVDYQETADITFTLWLEDPDMLSKYTGQKVTIKNFKLITSEQKFKLTFIDRTTSFNGTSNGLYWVQNSNAKLWAYDATSKNCVELKNTIENPTKWTGEISQEFINNKNNNLYFLRTSPEINAATVNPDDSTKYWNKWTAKLADDVSGGRSFTAYSNIVNSGSEKLGTWGDVIEITLDSEDSDSLEKIADESIATNVTIRANNVSYEMNYKNVDGVAVWRSYIPVENSNDEFVFSFSNGSSYSYNAGKRGSSVQYVITSESTGYWAPPATVKVIAGTSSDGTALGTVSVTGGKTDATEVKVTPGTSVVLKASPVSDSYRFIGWYTNPECTAVADLEKVEDGHKFTPATNKPYVFYAKFQLQYHVKLTAVTGDIYPNSTGGTVQLNSDAATSQVDTYLLDDGSENANVTFTAANKEGYNFLGWYKKATGTGTLYSSEKVISINAVKENYILYAKYKIKQFSVTAVAKPADSSDGSKVTFTAPPNADTGTTVSVTVDYNGSATFKAIPDSDNGYKFVGWYTDEALSNKVKDADGKEAGAVYTMNNIKLDNDGKVILYAKFELKDVKVTAVAVTGTNSPDSTGGTVKIGTGTAGNSVDSTGKYGNSFTLTAAANDGYRFVGWYDAATGGSALNSAILANSGTYTDSTITLASVKDDTKVVYARFELDSLDSNYYLMGINDDWSTGVRMQYTDTTKKAVTCTVSLSNADYSFKIKNTSTSTWYTMKDNNGRKVPLNKTVDFNEQGGTDNNSEVNISTAGDYIFTFDISTADSEKLTIKDLSKIKTIYFTNSAGWTGTKFYCYAWNTDGSDKNYAWPGLDMTYVGTNSSGQHVYSYNIDTSKYKYVIFNNNDKQTPNLDLTDTDGFGTYNQCYYDSSSNSWKFTNYS